MTEMNAGSWTFEIRDAVRGQVMHSVELDETDLALSLPEQRAEALYVALERHLPLVGADLSDMNADYIEMGYTDLIGVALRNSRLRRANLNGVNFSGADLSGADLSGASLVGARLCGASLSGACLQEADLRGANLSGAVLLNVDLSGALLNGALLNGAVCTGTVFEGCDLASASSFGAEMKHARFEGARWRDIPLARRPIRVSGLDYDVTILEQHIVVGSTTLTMNDLARLGEREAVSKGGVRALRFIRNFKGVIESLFACRELVRDVPQIQI
ncbi:pentapeptide repeat-containing protein [Asaia sp. VD9]|uniref:pentapeptide repeat-containing protein n=1 Tax=Asaia sp. VD9 TaxID=3081235 RepID=UPI003019A082